MRIRAHVFVSGRVQGVFFRSETMYEALRHHVTGWVRNMSDGRVEAVFEGEDEAVGRMVEFCKRGPPAAKVESIEVLREPYSGEYADFEAR